MITITNARATVIGGRMHLHLTAGGSPVTFEIESAEVALALASALSRGVAGMEVRADTTPQHHHIDGDGRVTPR